MATFITAAIDAFREDPVKATLLGLAGFNVASFLYKAGRFVHAHFLTGLPDLAASYGASAGGSAASSSFVVVTGATNEGIGYAFAQEFAAQGFSIALVGRGAKLERVREKLAGQYPDVEIRAIAVPDLGSVGGKDDPAIGSIVGALGDDDVAGIVHAAGMETASRKFTDSDLPWNRTVLCVNALCPALLTQALLPKMTGRVARGEAKKSALVFVGAGFGLRPTSHVTLYSASKSFVHYFGIGMAGEFKDELDVVTVHPLGVSTAMVQEKPDGLVMITPKQCARATLQKLGRSYTFLSWTNGWWVHEVQWAIMSSLPAWMYGGLTKFMIMMLVEQKKAEAEEKRKKEGTQKEGAQKEGAQKEGAQKEGKRNFRVAARIAALAAEERSESNR